MPLPPLWLAFAFIAGIALASQAYLPLLVWAVTAIVGGWRYQVAQPLIDPFHIAWHNNRDYEVLVTAMIIESPDVRDLFANLKVEVQQVDTGNDQPLPAEGKILTRADLDEPYE